jgi:hypothetical protein
MRALRKRPGSASWKRRAPREDSLPAVSSSRCLAKDVDEFLGVDPVFVGCKPSDRELGDEHVTFTRALRELDDATPCLAGIREGLALSELDLEEPLSALGFGKAKRTAFAEWKMWAAS